MKKVLLVLASALMFQGCSTDNTTTQPILPVDQAVINSASSNDSPMFLDKLRLGKNYDVKASMKKHARNSICGKDDEQEVNSYDGTDGPTVAFVKAHQGAVAAMEDKGTDNSSKFCSGTMISEDLFLTASHCVEDGDATTNYLAFNYEKAKGSSTLLKQSHFKVLEVVEEGGSNRMDYSILRIDGKPGAKFGINKVNVAPATVGQVISDIAHPSGLPKQVSGGNVQAINLGVYMSYANMSTQPGSSGSGVLNENGEVIAVHTNGGCTSSGGANKGVMLSEIVKVSKTIQDLVKTQKTTKVVKK